MIDKAHEGDAFSRTWSSFDALKKGDVIGTRHDGTVLTAPEDGWIVFPDVGAKPGHEWFYLALPNPQVFSSVEEEVRDEDRGDHRGEIRQ